MSHLLHGSNQINTFVSSFELFFKNKKIRSFKFIKSSKNTSNDQKNSSNEKVQIITFIVVQLNKRIVQLISSNELLFKRP